MNSFPAFLVFFAGWVMAPAALAWSVEKKPQPNTYLLAMISFLIYSLGFFLLLFSIHKTHSMGFVISIAAASVGTAIAAIWVWKKYRKAYPKSR